MHNVEYSDAGDVTLRELTDFYDHVRFKIDGGDDSVS